MFQAQPHDLQQFAALAGCEPHQVPPSVQIKLGIAREVMNHCNRHDAVPFELNLLFLVETVLADPPPEVQQAMGQMQSAPQPTPPGVQRNDYTARRENGLLGQHYANDEMLSPPPPPLPMTIEQLAGMSGASVMFIDEKKGGLNSGLLQGTLGDMALILTSESSRPVAVPAGDIRVQG